MKRNNQLYLAVDEDGDEILSVGLPERRKGIFRNFFALIYPSKVGYWKSPKTKIILPRGCIKLLLSRELSWKDEPINLGEIKK